MSLLDNERATCEYCDQAGHMDEMQYCECHDYAFCSNDCEFDWHHAREEESE